MTQIVIYYHLASFLNIYMSMDPFVIAFLWLGYNKSFIRPYQKTVQLLAKNKGLRVVVILTQYLENFRGWVTALGKD